MKIEPGGFYRNKVTGQKVRVESIEGRNVYFTQIGNIFGEKVTSIRDFGLKYMRIKK